MIIAFSGLDGAGKSTQIELLINELKAKKKKSRVIWSRGGYTPGILWIKSLIRKRGGKNLPESGPSPERTAAFQRPLVRKVWLWLAIWDLLFIYCIKGRWLNLTGHYVIYDRYIEDTLIDFDQNFPMESISSWLSWKLLKTLSPKPFRHFILLIPVEESQRRSKFKNEPFPDSVAILRMRLSRYNEMLKKAKRYLYVDCMRAIETIHFDIKKELLS